MGEVPTGDLFPNFICCHEKRRNGTLPRGFMTTKSEIGRQLIPYIAEMAGVHRDVLDATCQHDLNLLFEQRLGDGATDGRRSLRPQADPTEYYGQIEYRLTILIAKTSTSYYKSLIKEGI
jgi:hypothetical protein